MLVQMQAGQLVLFSHALIGCFSPAKSSLGLAS